MQLPALSISATLSIMASAAAAAAQDDQKLLEDARSAAPDDIARNARVVDWNGEILQEGDNGYVCFPTPPKLEGTAPVCFDEPWQKWADAWMNKEPFRAGRVGTAYTLAGDGGASNTDPFAEGPTADNAGSSRAPSDDHRPASMADPA